VLPLKSQPKSPPHKQHIYFFPMLKANTKKIKELFFANALNGTIKN
jgi:hypothetical protein